MSIRGKSLDWWKSLSFSDKLAFIEKWRNSTSDRRRLWQFELINASSSCIEQIYMDLNIKN